MIVNYRDFSVIAIKAIQEQQVMIDALKEEIADIASIRTEMAELRAQMKRAGRKSN